MNTEKPFGWWDSFNEVLYRNEKDAKLAEAGGNQITPLYTKPIAHTCIDRPHLPCDACEVPVAR